jgi:phosphomevalonate kinase
LIETRAPGKLFILGEYAVVEPGEPAVLVAVDRYLRVRLTECAIAPIRHYSDHVLAAIQVIDELRTERGLPPRHFELEIESELDDESGLK